MATTGQRQRIERWCVNVADCCGPTVKTYRDPGYPEEVTFPQAPPSILADAPTCVPVGQLVRTGHRSRGSGANFDPLVGPGAERIKDADGPVTIVRRYKSKRDQSPPVLRKSAPQVVRVVARSSHESDEGKLDRRSQYSRSEIRTGRQTTQVDYEERDRETRRHREEDQAVRTSRRRDSPQEVVEVRRVSSGGGRSSNSQSPKQSVLRRVLRLPERESRRRYYEDSERMSRRGGSLDRRSRARSVDIDINDHRGRERRDSRETRSVHDPTIRRSVFDRPEKVLYYEDRERRRPDSYARDDRPRRSSSLRSRRRDWDDDFGGRWGDGFGSWSVAKDNRSRDWDYHEKEWERRPGRLPRPAPPPSASAWEAKRLSGRDYDGWYSRDSKRY